MNDQLRSLIPAPVMSTTDQVFDAMYRAIIKLDLPPGTKVSEADISKQLGVSRQPVRDAFFRLSEKGFLLIRPQRATLITKISEKGVRDAHFVREALEAACVIEATKRATSADLTELEQLIEDQQRAVDTRDREKFHDLDETFHKTICEIAGHGHVWTLIREKKAQMDRVRFLTLSSDSQLAKDEHVRLFDAIRSRDTALAEKMLRSHVSRILTVLPRIRVEHAQYFEDLE